MKPGIEQGHEEGELIGQFRVCEQLLDLPETPSSVLDGLTETELVSRIAVL